MLFLAPYPNKDTIKDGMYSRIKSIDMLFTDTHRVYISGSYTKVWKKNVIVKKDDLEYFQLNGILHFFSVLRLLYSCKHVYCHSVQNCWPFFFVLLFSKKKLILDAHGVCPEEELLYSNNRIIWFLYRIVEHVVFSKSLAVICVTNKMKQHFEKRYPKYRGEYIIYSILPNTIPTKINTNELNEYKNDKIINVIYSGGIAAWQNIDLMLSYISKLPFGMCKITLLVSNPSFIKEKIKKMNIIRNDLIVDSVQPEELCVFYKNADYAFVLRDDNIVNNVANPTKIVEYLSYGIIPIVLSENIGDYKDRGYEYVFVEDFINHPIKPSSCSIRNVEIARTMINENRIVNLRNKLEVIWGN